MRSKSLTSLLMRIRQMVGPRPIFNLFSSFKKFVQLYRNICDAIIEAVLCIRCRNSGKAKIQCDFFFRKKYYAMDGCTDCIQKNLFFSKTF